MSKIIEFDTDKIIELSKRVWSKYKNESFKHGGKGVAIIDYVSVESQTYIDLLSEMPWLSGKVSFIILEPGAVCPIHTDIHEKENYFKSLNVIIESDDSNHSTRYYEYIPGNWDFTRTNLYDEPMTNLKMTFEFTLKKPTLFYNQDWHDVNNYGSKRRVTAMWLVDKNVSEKEILDWCNENNITYNVLY